MMVCHVSHTERGYLFAVELFPQDSDLPTLVVFLHGVFESISIVLFTGGST